MADKPMISVIVPMLNEADSLEELYDRTRRALDDIAQPFEFIAVDDGSTDGTLSTLKRLRERHGNVCILSHYCNHGKSLALMQAFSVARGEVAVILDADLQDLPEMIPRLLDKLAEGYDLVNGWRRQRRDAWSKRLVSSVYNRLTARLLRCPMHDINCGMKAMRRTVYRRLELRGDLHRLIPALAISLGFRAAEVPVDHAPRRFGNSKYKLLRHRGLLDIVALVAGQATRLRPFHVFCELAIGAGAVALLSLIGWAALTVGVPAESWLHRLGGPLTAVVGLGAAWLTITLPLFGFLMEAITCRIQDAPWRGRLLKEHWDAELEPGREDDQRGESTTDVPRPSRWETLLEPAAQSLSDREGAGLGWLDLPPSADVREEPVGGGVRGGK
jgi:hypothetical protein